MSLLVFTILSSLSFVAVAVSTNFCFVCQLSFFCFAVSRPCLLSVFNLYASVLWKLLLSLKCKIVKIVTLGYTVSAYGYR